MPDYNPIQQLKSHFITEADNLDSSFNSSNPTGHPTDTGENRQDLLIRFLNAHLPSKYEALPGGKIFDINNNLTEQVDVLVYDKSTPKLGNVSRQLFLVEGVTTAIEVKPELNITSLREGIQKAKSFKTVTKSFSGQILIGNLRTKIYSGIFAYTLGTSKEAILEELVAQYQDIDDENCIDFVCVNKKFIILKNRPGEWTHIAEDGTHEQVTARFMPQESEDMTLYRLLMLISANSAQLLMGIPDYSKYINIR